MVCPLSFLHDCFDMNVFCSLDLYSLRICILLRIEYVIFLTCSSSSKFSQILSWELVAKRGASWTLHYVKSAYAVTDVPDQVPELISQRRRWFNGSFFAGVHSIAHFYYIYRSSHSFARKACIHIQMVYQLCNLILSWFALANYYITFALVSESIEDKSFNLPKWIKTVNVILHYSYLGLLMMCFILGLGNRPQGSKWGYTVAMIGFSVITICVTVRFGFWSCCSTCANILTMDLTRVLLAYYRRQRSFLPSRVSKTLPARMGR